VRSPLLTRGAKALVVDRNYGAIHDFAVNQYKEMIASAQEIPRQATDMIKEVGASTTKFALEMLVSARDFQADPSGFKLGSDFFVSPPSNVMKRLPGFSVGVSAFGGSLIDTTQFSWRFGVRLVLKLLSVRVGQEFTPVLWQILADSMDDYDEYLVKPGFRACAGMGVMLGYSNPWARVFRESCSSAVATQATAAETVRVLFVYIPTLACICRDAQGSNFATYAQDNCWDPAPDFMKPIIAKLIMTTVTSSASQTDVCKTFGSDTEDLLRAIMDPVLQHAYAATEAVGSSLDYLTVFIDPHAGSCSNLLSSPYTMAIVPEPIDYFRACGKTHTCRSKCITVFEEFEAIKERLAASTNTFDFHGSVEKRFFSSMDVSQGKSVTPFEILAMIEVPSQDNCTAMDPPEPCCGSSDVRDRCVIVCGFNNKLVLEVVEYCVPYNVGIGTHERVRWNVAVEDASEVRSVHFGTRTELVVATAGGVHLYGWGRTMQVLMEPLDFESAEYSNTARMHRIAWVFVSPGNYGIIHGFINTPEKAVSSRASVCIDLNVKVDMRRYPVRCNTNLNIHLDGHIPTSVGTTGYDLLMLPTNPDASVRYCERNSRSSFDYTCVDSGPTPQLSQDLGFGDSTSATYVITTSFTAVRSTPVLSANTLSVGNASLATLTRIFSATPSSISSTWLQEVRVFWDMQKSSDIIDAFKTGSHSIKASITIEQRCDVDDCSGCTIPAVQRACFSVQQCAVAKCIGTVVNLERPLCSIGRLLQAGLDVDLAKIHGKDRFPRCIVDV
jgi:hypothetical protein